MDITFWEMGVRKALNNYWALRSHDFISSEDTDIIETKWRNTVMIDYIFRTSPDNELEMCYKVRKGTKGQLERFRTDMTSVSI